MLYIIQHNLYSKFYVSAQFILSTSSVFLLATFAFEIFDDILKTYFGVKCILNVSGLHKFSKSVGVSWGFVTKRFGIILFYFFLATCQQVSR